MYLPLLHQRLCDQLGKPSLEGFACQLDVWWCLPGITQHDVSRWSQRMPCDDKEPGDTWLIIALYKFLWTAVCDLCHSFSLNGSWLLQPVPRFEMLRGMWTMRAWTSTCPHQRRPTSSWHLSWAPKYVYIYYIYIRGETYVAVKDTFCKQVQFVWCCQFRQLSAEVSDFRPKVSLQDKGRRAEPFVRLAELHQE